MLIPFLLLSNAASAADITTLPPQYRGDVAIAYRATVVPDTLEEDGATVGERRSTTHKLEYSVLFSATDYLAIQIGLPHTARQTIQFSESNAMVYDPIDQTGTMRNTSGIADSTRSGSGLGGTRIRLVGTPFSESVFAARGDQVSWLIEVGMQFSDDSNFWTVAGGERGAGPASPAFELDSTWSTDHQYASPYIGVSWTRRSPHSDGQVPIKDPSDLVLFSGLEIPIFEDPNWANGLGTELTMDLSGRFGFHTYGDGVSGVLLPATLPISTGKAVTQSEASSLWGHMDVRWRAARYIDWSLNSAVGGVFGHRLEHHYPVRTATAGKVGWSAGTTVTFRARDPLFDAR